MKQFLIPAAVMSLASATGFAAEATHAMQAEATWQVTANKDSSSAISITPVTPNAAITYNPFAKKFEEARLPYTVRIMNSSDYTVSGYKVKASSTKNQLKLDGGNDTADFALAIQALGDAGQEVRTLTSTPTDLQGLQGFGLFKDKTTAGEHTGQSVLIANFSTGTTASGSSIQKGDESKLSDGSYKGEFNLILDASWSADPSGTPGPDPQL